MLKFKVSTKQSFLLIRKFCSKSKNMCVVENPYTFEVYF